MIGASPGSLSTFPAASFAAGGREDCPRWPAPPPAACPACQQPCSGARAVSRRGTALARAQLGLPKCTDRFARTRAQTLRRASSRRPGLCGSADVWRAAREMGTCHGCRLAHARSPTSRSIFGGAAAHSARVQRSRAKLSVLTSVH
jgi:hypothetical protein